MAGPVRLPGVDEATRWWRVRVLGRRGFSRYPYRRPLLELARRDHHLVAGLQNGDLLLTEDAGETWRTLHTGLDGLLALSESAE